MDKIVTPTWVVGRIKIRMYVKLPIAIDTDRVPSWCLLPAPLPPASRTSCSHLPFELNFLVPEFWASINRACTGFVNPLSKALKQQPILLLLNSAVWLGISGLQLPQWLIHATFSAKSQVCWFPSAVIDFGAEDFLNTIWLFDYHYCIHTCVLGPGSWHLGILGQQRCWVEAGR